MTMSTPPTTDLAAVAEAIRSHDRFLLVTHENPDGDALGSILGAKLALDRLGKESVMYLGGETAPPTEYGFLALDELRRELPGDAGDGQPRALPEVVVVDLGDGSAESLLQLCLRRFDVLTLALQRPGFREVQLDREDADIARAHLGYSSVDGGIVTALAQIGAHFTGTVDGEGGGLKPHPLMGGGCAGTRLSRTCPSRRGFG